MAVRQHTLKTIHLLGQQAFNLLAPDEQLGRLSELMSKPEDDMTEAEARCIETFGLLVEAFEKQHYPMPKTKPEDVLYALLEANGMKQQQLVEAGVFHSKSGASQAVSGDRPLTRDQIAALSKLFHVSPAIFF